ncbi:MAG: CotH kinase family protein, partial [Ignavibacteria bacterium]|nr:CotH kinase family protein [Ignavibacteria bacterium]
MAQAVINNIVYDSIGVRFKGHSSYTHPNNKKPFRLSFDAFGSDVRWDGLKGIHLNNCWEDPTFLREKLHLDFCRDAGIPAPRANFAEVYLNDSLFGFYSLVEHVDKRFLNSRYGNNYGDLFKAVDGFGDTSQILSDFRWFGSDTSLYMSRYELKNNESGIAWKKLVLLIDSLNNSSNISTTLPNLVNVNSLYRALATDILFGSLDSYVGSSRNFYFYFNPITAKMDWIVWDASLSFGAYPSGGVANIENLSVTYVKSVTQRPLFGKIITNSSLKNEYLYQLCTIFRNHFSPAKLFPRIDSIANIIRPYVYKDQRKMFTNQQFETNISSDLTIGSFRKPGLKSFITSRTSSVNSQLNSLGINCNQTINKGDVVINEFMAQNDSIPDPAGEFDDWIELFNTTTNTINLSGLYLS